MRTSFLLPSEDNPLCWFHLQKHFYDLNGSYAIVLRSLWKRFDTRSSIAKLLSRLNGSRAPVVDKIAVKNISLVFPKGEVFGLLGPNGAGKTTTLSMITGEVTPTSGDIHVNGFNMHTQTLSAIETMGSCPQSDTLWDDITMEEHLNLFAILNDLPPSRSQDSIKIFSEGLCITEHMGKKATALSAGTKRKMDEDDNDWQSTNCRA
ncbi:putative ATP-binding cassette sub-family A member 5 [Hypsibius exemplaris]|uniref:ATP-binding cassette sub-family A member 5 n=1 Tax=Hypsibius exemplaris TaxID=2072580 RepID=A0A1W0X9V6_HYPEX|nr:putative ATP-binding cassette sub-family A member 5 [Hypsibius exemplaris]